MACIVQPGSVGGFQKLFFGREEIAIPQYGSVDEAVAAHPRADVFINFASFRRWGPRGGAPSWRAGSRQWRPRPGGRGAAVLLVGG